MNEPNTDNQQKKNRFSTILDVGAMPLWRIAEIPLSLFDPLSKFFEVAWNYLIENPLLEWMGDMRDEHPKVFWISSVAWIPLAIVICFCALDLLFILGIASIIGLIAMSLLFTAICKLTYLLNLIMSNIKWAQR